MNKIESDYIPEPVFADQRKDLTLRELRHLRQGGLLPFVRRGSQIHYHKTVHALVDRYMKLSEEPRPRRKTKKSTA
jgi:hypothetical protein